MVFGMGKPNIKKMQREKNVEELIKLLEHEDKKVRTKAVYALGEIGDTRAVEPLTNRLKYEKMYTRARVAWALNELGWKEK